MVLENIQESTRDTRALDLCLKAFVAFFTISMFWAIVSRNSHNVFLFKNGVQALRPNNEPASMKRWRDRLLVCNYYSNVVLGWYLFLLIVPYTFTAQSTGDAILNGIAIGFIIQPLQLSQACHCCNFKSTTSSSCFYMPTIDFNLTTIQAKLNSYASEYIQADQDNKESSSSDQVHVKRYIAGQNGSSASKSPYSETDSCYAFAYETAEPLEEHRRDSVVGAVSVFRMTTAQNSTLYVDNCYQEIRYEIVGDVVAKSFFNNLKNKFDCIESDDMHQAVNGTNRAPMGVL